VLGEQHPDTVASLNNLARFPKKVTAARPATEKAPAGGPAANKTARERTADANRQQQALAELQRLVKEARQLEADEKLPQAIAAGEQATLLARGLDGDVSETVAAWQDWLGQLHERLEEWQAAQKALEDVLAIRRKLHGERDWRATDARLALQQTIRLSQFDAPQRRQLAKATDMNEEVLRLYRQGQFGKAVQSAQQSLAICKKILGETHRDYAASLNNLAELYQSQGDYARAEPLYRQAVEIGKKVLGETHPQYATGLNNLAMLYHSQGDYARAEPLLRQALEIRKKALGETHSDYAQSLNNVALLYKSKGDNARAEPLYRLALEIDKKVLGETHPHYATDLNNLAELYHSQGDYARAEPLLRQASEIWKKVETHPDYASSLSNLAELYYSQRDYLRAEPLFRQVLEIRKKVLGETHPDYATSLSNLALLYYSQGDYPRAEPVFWQALEIRKKALGETHPQYARSLNDLAALYHSQGDYARAEPLFRLALEIDKKVLGETHPQYARSLNNLAYLYESQGDYARAEPLFRRALEISQALLSRSFGALSERRQLAFEAASRFYLDSYLSVAWAAHVSGAETYHYVLLGKGAVTARQALMRVERRRPELKERFQKLEEVNRRLASLSRPAPAAGQRDVLLRELERLQEEREGLQRELATKSSEFRELRESLEMGPRQWKKLLDAIPPNAALVDVLEYWHSASPAGSKGPLKWERRLVAFVVRPGAEVKRVELGLAAPIAQKIKEWRQDAVEHKGSPPLERSPWPSYRNWFGTGCGRTWPERTRSSSRRTVPCASFRWACCRAPSPARTCSRNEISW
jgi:tetratricopeptide (TPR) repeat protein